MGRPVGSILQVSVRYTSCGQQLLNVLGYRVITQSTEGDVQAEQAGLASQLNAANNLIDKMRACMSNETTVQDVTVQFIRDTRFARTVLEVDAPGTIAEPCATANVACTITKRTEYSGRWAVGAFHIGGLPNTAYDGGLIDTDYKTVANALGAQLLDNIGGVGGGLYQPVIIHPPGTHGGYSALIATETQDTLRVMRRRTVGLGI